MEYPNSAPQNPLVSVCIQTYNHAGFISECLDGVLAQERDFPMEIILGEDDSTDGTREICIQYAEKYPELIRLFLRREEDKIWINGQKTGRFNFMSNLQAAKGKYIALCDGDDYWTDPKKLGKQVQTLETNGYSLCGTNGRPFFQGSQRFGPPFYGIPDFREYSSEDLVYQNYFSTSTLLFIRPKGSLPAWFWEAPYLDWSLNFYLTITGKGIIIKEDTTIYRLHPGGMWNQISFYQKTLNRIAMRNLFLQEIDKGSIKKVIFRSQLGDAKRALRFNKGFRDMRFTIEYLFKHWMTSLWA